MERIVILSNPSEEDDILIACLQILFPECEVQVKSKETENLGSNHTRSQAMPARRKGELCHGEYPDRG
jgi:hypothetical protein